MWGRRARLRRWWHERKGHAVVRTVVDAYTPRERKPFHYRPGLLCIDCKVTWR